MYILRHIISMQVWPDTLPLPETCKCFNLQAVIKLIVIATPLMKSAINLSPRAHLLHLYPLLLEIAFSKNPLASMWVFPHEHDHLFRSKPISNVAEVKINGSDSGPMSDIPKKGEEDAGDGGDLIQVSASDLARRCLNLIGEELGLVTL